MEQVRACRHARVSEHNLGINADYTARRREAGLVGTF